MKTAEQWRQELQVWYPQPDHVLYQILKDMEELEKKVNPPPAKTYNYDMYC